MERLESCKDDLILHMNIDKDNVAEYVYTRHLLNPPAEGFCSIEGLGGGFLNTVLRVSVGNQSVVVKQALDALRLFSDLKVSTDRIVYETEALRVLDRLFPRGTVPSVLYFDDENRILVMSDLGKRASLETDLEKGQVDLAVAGRLGMFLSSLHRRLADTFTKEKEVLLHGDFWTASVMATEEQVHTFDLEFVNYGHPAQDVGFIMAHYLLHAYNNPRVATTVFDAVECLWSEYKDGMGGFLPEEIETTALQQAGLEMLFRIDGINQVSYIINEEVKVRIRGAARHIMLDGSASVAGLRTDG